MLHALEHGLGAGCLIRSTGCMDLSTDWWFGTALYQVCGLLGRSVLFTSVWCGVLKFFMHVRVGVYVCLCCFLCVNMQTTLPCFKETHVQQIPNFQTTQLLSNSPQMNYIITTMK